MFIGSRVGLGVRFALCLVVSLPLALGFPFSALPVVSYCYFFSMLESMFGELVGKMVSALIATQYYEAPVNVGLNGVSFTSIPALPPDVR